ncbi:hypothetical protein QQS21_010143 [Conoideocrella luteorostrata]|uniref:Uncharacterized protein n=1 Tax=Conoideocrella luteorostrata TaxID=1105319 RepID=A0AAJ0CK39_9HYPO|nr:hypothetical protein QQS21_010143 [Conoideocrella luteorostrata]
MAQATDVEPRSLVDGFWEHGRFYGSWRARKYLIPIDEEELTRLDVFHKVFLVAQKDALFVAPLHMDEKHPLRILDLGTGTGIWSFNVAETAEVQPEIMSVDLHQIQPARYVAFGSLQSKNKGLIERRIPPGVCTLQFDIEDTSWEPLLKECDLVYLRTLYGSIHNHAWPDIYRNSFEHLRPGHGYIEHLEIDWVPRWEGNIPPKSALNEWSRLFLQGLDRFDRNARTDVGEVRKAFDKAGFVDFKEETIRCCVSPWTSDRHERDLARWFNFGFCNGIEAMSLMPMIEGLQMTKEEVQELCGRVKSEICHLKNHAFVTL